MPRVSVIILSNRIEYLPEAFDSVVAQTYTDREIVVKFFDGAWWPSKMDEAVAGTSGELFAFLCDDDKMAPTWLAKCVEASDATGADIAYTDNEVFGRLPLKLALPDFSLDTVRLHCVPHFTALTRRTLYEAVKKDRGHGYDGTQAHVDWDFWKACADVGARAAHVHEYLMQYRVEGQNQSVAISDDGLAQLKAKHPDLLVEPTRRERVA